ncbi:hypothetical protein [Falsirhodobacter algicola]|nr:hypothetical protein [Falsirhodobacter algicola]
MTAIPHANPEGDLAQMLRRILGDLVPTRGLFLLIDRLERPS